MRHVMARKKMPFVTNKNEQEWKVFTGRWERVQVSYKSLSLSSASLYTLTQGETTCFTRGTDNDVIK